MSLSYRNTQSIICDMGFPYFIYIHSKTSPSNIYIHSETSPSNIYIHSETSISLYVFSGISISLYEKYQFPYLINSYAVKPHHPIYTYTVKPQYLNTYSVEPQNISLREISISIFHTVECLFRVPHTEEMSPMCKGFPRRE